MGNVLKLGMIATLKVISDFMDRIVYSNMYNGLLIGAFFQYHFKLFTFVLLAYKI